MLVRSKVRCICDIALVLFAFNEILDCLFESLARLDHRDHELPLEEAVIAWDVFIEALVTTASSYQQLLSLELASCLAGAD